MNNTLDEITRACDGLLRNNRVHSKMDGQPFRYTRPAPSTYEQQWLWDSCFHAIALRWLDPAMAWDELRAVVAHAIPDGPDAGMLPHMTYWDGGGRVLWRNPDRSDITQSSLVALAAMRTHTLAPNVDSLRHLYPRIAAHHEWLDRRRDPDGDDLVVCIHPWECGWDASPRLDPAMSSVVENGDYSYAALRAGRMRLAAVCQDVECDPLALRDAGYFHVEQCDFNALRAADLEALSEMAGVGGRRGAAAPGPPRARKVQSAVASKLWRSTPHGGHQVVDLSGSGESALCDGGAQQYTILFGGCATPEMARELAAQIEHSLASAPYALTTVPTGHPAFDPDRYWRGNVWLQVNWQIFHGLRRYGFESLAGEIAQRSAALLLRSGPHEFFNPLTGAGRGANPYSAAAVVLDMISTLPAGGPLAKD